MPTRFLLATKDRLLAADFQRRLARQRLGLMPDEIEAGHLPALRRPNKLAQGSSTTPPMPVSALGGTRTPTFWSTAGQRPVIRSSCSGYRAPCTRDL